MKTFSLLSALVALLPLVAFAEDAPVKVTYDDDVKPIFRAKCFNCHNTDKKTAGLDLTSYTGLMQGGASGASVEAGDPSTSYLWMVVAHETEPYMPPMSPKLEDATLATIRTWIELGAPENKGSKVAAKKKVDLSLGGVPTGKPEGPPPMPGRLPLEPVRHTDRADAVTALAASPWAPLVAVGGFEQVLLYDAKSLGLVGVLPFPEGTPNVLKFSRNGKLLLAGGGRGAYQGICVLWDVATGKRIAEVGDELDAVLAADVSPDQTLVATGGPSRKVRVYSIATGEVVYELKKHTEWVYAVEFSPDGVLLATADRNGGLFVWEAAGGQEFLTLDGHKTAVNAVSWRADSNLLASCDDEGQVRLWELENGKGVKNWGAHGGGAKWVEFARDGRLVTAGVDKTAKLWKTDGAQEKAFPAFGDLALRAVYVAEADRVVAGDWTGEVRVWNAADGAPVGVLTPNPPTIEARLGEAVAAVATNQGAFDAAAAEMAAAEARMNEATAGVAQAQAAVAAAEAAKVQAEAKAKEFVAKLAAATAERTQAAEAVKLADAALPPLKAAAEPLRAAAGAEGATDVSKQAVDAADAAVAEQAKKIEAAKVAETQAAERLAAATKESEAATAAVAAAGPPVETAKQAVPPAEAAAKAMAEKLAPARDAKAATEAALVAARAAETRWRDELAYAKQQAAAPVQ